jgi:hypothetical protein
MKSIWFDMDGTIADLYKVEGWLPKLRNNEWSVYSECAPRAHANRIRNAVAALIEEGWQVGVITWASKGVEWGKDLNDIAEVKFNWLCQFFPEIADGQFACIPYGYSKAVFLEEMAENNGDHYSLCYLVDDNKEVRADWRSHGEQFKTIDASRAFARVLEGLVM